MQVFGVIDISILYTHLVSLRKEDRGIIFMIVSLLPTHVFSADIVIDESILSRQEPQIFTTGTYTLKDVKIDAGGGNQPL